MMLFYCSAGRLLVHPTTFVDRYKSQKFIKNGKNKNKKKGLMVLSALRQGH